MAKLSSTRATQNKSQKQFDALARGLGLTPLRRLMAEQRREIVRGSFETTRILNLLYGILLQIRRQASSDGHLWLVAQLSICLTIMRLNLGISPKIAYTELVKWEQALRI